MRVCDEKFQKINDFVPLFKQWFLDYIFQNNYAPYYIESLDVWEQLQPSFEELRSSIYDEYRKQIAKESNTNNFCSLKVELFFKNSMPKKSDLFSFFNTQSSLFDEWFTSSIYNQVLNQANIKFALMENLLQQSILLHQRFHANNPLTKEQMVNLSTLTRSLVSLLIQNFVVSTELQLDPAVRVDNHQSVKTYLANLLNYPQYFKEQVDLKSNTKQVMSQITTLLDLRIVKDCPAPIEKVKVVAKKNKLNRILLGTTILSVGYLIYKQAKKPKNTQRRIEETEALRRLTDQYAQTNIKPIQVPKGQPQQIAPEDIDDEDLINKPYLGL